jgi:hypothetical protein
MLATMSPDLKKQYEHVDAYTMIEGLRGMFQNQARTERYNISKSLFACKLAEGSLVSPHVIKMIDYIETLEKLGSELHPDMATNVILQSLPVSYEPFVMNFQMDGLDKTLSELHGMLKTAEESVKKNPNNVMMIQKGDKKRKHWTPPNPKGKGKEKSSSSESSGSKLKPTPKAKSSPTSEDECFHCHEKGHWFRNCKKYLEEKKKKKGSETSTSGINVIEINIALSSSESWVFDTGSMIHTCKSLQSLSETRRLQSLCETRRFARGELDVRVGNGAKVAVLAVRIYHLSLPSELVLELNNCYCIPPLSKKHYFLFMFGTS